MITLDDVLLRLHDEVVAEIEVNPLFDSLIREEADQILNGRIRYRRQEQFVRICRDLGACTDEIRNLMIRTAGFSRFVSLSEQTCAYEVPTSNKLDTSRSKG